MKQFDQKKLAFIGLKLVERKETIAVAESVSGGLFQFALSSIENAAQLFQGGITVYNTAQKFKHLQVEPVHALEVNAVSQQVANQMALHVQHLFASHWGAGITGYASPVPESGGKTYAYFSIAYGHEIMCAGELKSSAEKPADVQHYYIEAVISNLHDLLTSK
ncbi:MAG TPA: CinA family protein [Lacibacter sp.]|jgi:PncC family amidohydrolase|nr:CinA family protein [Lacibacter sp.]